MKKNILLIILIFGAFALIGAGVMLVAPAEKNDKKGQEHDLYDLKEYGRIKTCFSEDCQNSVTDVYAKISYDYDSKVLQNAINNINKQIESDYKEASNSDVTSPQCSEIPSTNKHSIRYYHQYYSYTNNDIVYLAFKRDKMNICDGSNISYQVDAYYYDIKNDKMIDRATLLKRIEYEEASVESAIKEELSYLSIEKNITLEYNDKYKDNVIYYDSIGDLYVSFYVEELGIHRVALLENHTN